jgi:hypothetical protein
MRKLIVVFGIVGLGGSVLGAETDQIAALKKPAAIEQAKPPHSRCAKRIVLGVDRRVVACLMQKRKGVTEP